MFSVYCDFALCTFCLFFFFFRGLLLLLILFSYAAAPPRLPPLSPVLLFYFLLSVLVWFTFLLISIFIILSFYSLYVYLVCLIPCSQDYHSLCLILIYFYQLIGLSTTLTLCSTFYFFFSSSAPIPLLPFLLSLFPSPSVFFSSLSCCCLSCTYNNVCRLEVSSACVCYCSGCIKLL